MRTSPGPSRSTSAADVLDELQHHLDVENARDIRSTTGSSVRRHAAMIGDAAFLLPPAAARPLESG